MAGLWRNNPETAGGKYLVMRRDGTVPDWPFFVMGARDPVAPWALRAYAVVAWLMRYDRAYCRDLWALARDFSAFRRKNGKGDPDAPRHRTDDPATIAKMASSKGA